MDNSRFGLSKIINLLALLWLGVFAAQVSTLRAAQPAEDEATRAEGRRGVDLMMDGDLNGAIETFRDIQKKDPLSPVGYLLEADAVWWKIYYSTANLVDPDVFAATDLPSTPHDDHFGDLLGITISKSDARIQANQDLARSYLYQGMAYALRARLEGLRDRDLPTARAGKKMRTLLLKALELDPALTDAYLGVGIYNYFVDTLSSIVKILRFFIGLPGGSRTEGLKQMQLVAEKGDLARAEAKFYLAKDFSRQNERQFDRSLRLFRELAQEYPHNQLWPMLIASLQCRMGQEQACDAGYREVFLKTAEKKGEVDQALRRASGQALQRRHPQEQFPE